VLEVLVVDNEQTVGMLLVDALRRRGIRAEWVGGIKYEKLKAQTTSMAGVFTVMTFFCRYCILFC
jgi:hypothetical protein